MPNNLNYSNPESMYPLQTTNPNSGTDGAGTVPASFMAGMLLPERMQDYRTARDLSNQSSLLQNQHLAATNEDYNLAGPSRMSTYNLTTGENQGKLGLLPQQNELARMNLGSDIKRQPTEAQDKLHKALNSLNTTDRQEYIDKLVHAGTILQTYRNQEGNGWAGDPHLISNDMKQKYNVDIDPAHMEGVISMLPDIRKAQAEFRLKQYEETQHSGRQSEINATNLEIARQRNEYLRNGNAKFKAEQELEAKAREILKKHYSGKQLTPDDRSDLTLWQTNKAERYYAGGAHAAGSMAETSGLMDIINGRSPTPPGNLPPSGNEPHQYNVGDKATLDGEDIEIANDYGNGTVRVYSRKRNQYSTVPATDLK